jgi:acyl-CoA reductase-like NAD-dependent aldehyde dehydrogenase
MQQIFINGAFIDAAVDAVREVVNPATLERLDTVPDCGAVDVARAVGAARAAQPEWQALSPARKGALLHDIGARVRAQAKDLAILLTRESGKPLCESADCVDAVVMMFDEGRALLREGGGAPDGSAGVVAAMTPYNFPLLFMASAIVSALTAGSAIVCKPAHQNPLTNLRLAAAFDALPAGTVNVITGGADTGSVLARHAGVTEVKFTGSAAVGDKIAALSPGRRVDLEPGCVGALIVCADADLEVTVPAIAWARLFNGGQVCTSGKHFYVERSIAEEFVERLHQCIGFLDVDDPIKRPTDLGPLISLEAANRVEDQVGRSLREGAKLILGGRRFRPSGLPGHFFQPTILTSVPVGGVPMREEILGPVLTITPVTDATEAIRLSDAAVRGGASLYTRDPQAAMKLLRYNESGAFRINDPAVGNAGPFGGMRHRDIRHLLGRNALDYVVAALQRKAWWFPYQAREMR